MGFDLSSVRRNVGGLAGKGPNGKVYCLKRAKKGRSRPREKETKNVLSREMVGCSPAQNIRGLRLKEEGRRQGPQKRGFSTRDKGGRAHFLFTQPSKKNSFHIPMKRESRVVERVMKYWSKRKKREKTIKGS